MLNKLLRNLPFNPSLIEHVPSYIKAVKKQRNIKIAGLCIFAVAGVIEVLSLAKPPQPTITSSPNDLIRGGFSSQINAVDDCQKNTDNFRSILNHYDISCTNVLATTSTKIKDSLHSYYSLNRVNYGQNPTYSVNISKQQYYLRKFTTNYGSNNSALVGQSKNGQTFYLLYSSANLVFPRVVDQVFQGCSISNSSNCVKNSISVRNDSEAISDANGTTVKSGDLLIFSLVSANDTKQTVKNYKITDNFSSVLSYAKPYNLYGGTISNDVLSWPSQSIKPGNLEIQEAAFTIDNPIPNTPVSATDPSFYNSKMINVFGNTVEVKTPLSFSKFLELNINNELPFGSPIIGLILTILILLILIFFILFDSLLIAELNSLKDDYLDNDNG